MRTADDAPWISYTWRDLLGHVDAAVANAPPPSMVESDGREQQSTTTYQRHEGYGDDRSKPG